MGVGEAAGGLFPLPGIMNTVVGSFKSDTVGIARAEQIGMSKVTNVGQSQIANVGKEQRASVGETIHVQSGKLYKLIAQQSFVTVEGVPIATVGDRTLCSGVPTTAGITAGSAIATIDGRKVARQGDACEHGGKLVQGVSWLTFE